MKGAHLTLEDRKAIQLGLEEGKSKSQIAREIHKSPSTISKEIKTHRKFKLGNYYARNAGYFCANKGQYKECYGCKKECEHYVEKGCEKRERLGVCNLCHKNKNGACALDKYFYYATKAHEEYLYNLSDSREGINMTSSRMITMAETIGPLFKRGHSVYQILASHPELNISVKSLYNYIEAGIFKDYGIDNFSLRRQVKMKKRKELKPRKEPVSYDGHRYQDFLDYRAANPTVPATEMDLVYNDPDGPYIQTFIFENTSLMIGLLRNEKTSEAMASALTDMQELLGEDYSKLFSLILTDRGSEFQKHNLFEINCETGQMRTNIFYCDPQRPDQKPHVEKNHTYVRTIIPNGKKLSNMTHEDLDLVFSHINSVPRKILNGKTPYEVFTFYYGTEIPEKLNIKRIGKDDVTLMPYLLKID